MRYKLSPTLALRMIHGVMTGLGAVTMQEPNKDVWRQHRSVGHDAVRRDW